MDLMSPQDGSQWQLGNRGETFNCGGTFNCGETFNCRLHYCTNVFISEKHREKECIVHKIQHNPQAQCYVEMKISFEHYMHIAYKKPSIG